MTGIFVPWNPDRPNGPGWMEDGSGCHIWLGGRQTGGYGMVGERVKDRLVHRIRYLREIGPIPEGMELDHFRCSNRACCNPAHVRPVTRRENTLRGEGVAARCAARTHCPKGHPLLGDNLDRWQLAHGGRKCRICKKARMRDYYLRRKARHV